MSAFDLDIETAAQPAPTAREIFGNELRAAEIAYVGRINAIDETDSQLRKEAAWDAEDVLRAAIKRALWNLEKAAMQAVDNLVARHESKWSE